MMKYIVTIVLATICIVHVVNAQVKVPSDGMVVKNLKIAGPQNQPAEIVLRSGDNKVVMGVKPDGSFAIGSEHHPYLSVQDNMMFAHTKILATGGLSSADNMAVGNVLQWALIHSEDFANGAQGWGEECVLTCASSTHKSDKDCLAGSITPCGGIRMLGGYEMFAKGQVSKRYTKLRSHAEIRVTANFHFIDDWEGETAFMMTGSFSKNMNCSSTQYAWTHAYDAREVSSAISVCGGKTGEGRFAVPIDITVPHSEDTLDLIFGTTLLGKTKFDAAGAGAFWGVSGVNIYIR